MTPLTWAQCMSLPGRKSHMRRLHWPPRPRVWLCPGNMCHHASVGGPGISRPCTHRLIPDVILASAWGHLSLTSRIFSWKDEEAALEVLLYVSDSKDLVTKCNVILGSINLEHKLEITKMEHYMSQFKIKFDTTRMVPRRNITLSLIDKTRTLHNDGCGM